MALSRFCLETGKEIYVAKISIATKDLNKASCESRISQMGCASTTGGDANLSFGPFPPKTDEIKKKLDRGVGERFSPPLPMP